MATIKVKSTLDSRNYKKGIDQMKKKNSKFGKGLEGIKGKMKAAFAIGAIVTLVSKLVMVGKTLIDFGSKMSDMAAQTGVAVESFQKLQRAVRDAGGQDQHLVNALTRIRDAQGEVLTGDKLMTEAFATLGISAEQIASMSIEETFLAISKSLTASGNSAEQFSAVADIIGQRNVPKLLEAMNAASDGTDQLAENLEILSDRNAQALDLMADKWENLKQNIKASLAGLLAETFSTSNQKAIDKRIESGKRMVELERRNRLESLKRLREGQEKTRLDNVKKIQEAEEKIALARKQKIKDIQDSVKIEVQADSIRRIGGVAGSSVSQSLNYARKQTEIMVQIAEYEASLPKIEENTKNQGLL